MDRSPPDPLPIRAAALVSASLTVIMITLFITPFIAAIWSTNG